MEVEGIERATVTLNGTVELILPGRTGTRFQNIDGNWIEGRLVEVPFTQTRSFDINSAPVVRPGSASCIGAGGRQWEELLFQTSSLHRVRCPAFWISGACWPGGSLKKGIGSPSA